MFYNFLTFEEALCGQKKEKMHILRYSCEKWEGKRARHERRREICPHDYAKRKGPEKER